MLYAICYMLYAIYGVPYKSKAWWFFIMTMMLFHHDHDAFSSCRSCFFIMSMMLFHHDHDVFSLCRSCMTINFLIRNFFLTKNIYMTNLVIENFLELSFSEFRNLPILWAPRNMFLYHISHYIFIMTMMLFRHGYDAFSSWP